MEQQLALKDIHLPPAISWWPPAPGWWLLVLLLPLLMAGSYWLYRHLTRNTALKQASHMLRKLKLQTGDEPMSRLRELSALLRRVAISRDARQQVANLHGAAWLNFLDQGLSDAPFRSGPGRCLADAHFRQSPPTDLDLDAVFALCERWLQQQGKRRC